MARYAYILKSTVRPIKAKSFKLEHFQRKPAVCCDTGCSRLPAHMHMSSADIQANSVSTGLQYIILLRAQTA